MMSKKFYIFPLFLFVIPIFVSFLYPFFTYDKVTTIWYYLILYTCYFGGIYTCYYVKNHLQKTSFTKIEKITIGLFLFFLASCIISTICATSPITSLLGTSYRKEGLFTYLAYFFMIINCMFLKNNEKKKVYQLFVIVAFVLSIVSLLKIKFLMFPYQYSYNSIFCQFNHFSYFLILALVCNTCLFMFSDNKEEKIIYYITYLILFIQLILNNTFGGYLALLLTTIFICIYGVKFRKKTISVVIILITFIACSLFICNAKKESIVLKNFFDNTKEVIHTNFQNEEEIAKLGTTRGKLWIGALKMIEKKPILGYGLDNLKEEYFDLKMYDADKPHDFILALSAYIGIPGMLSFVLFVAIVLIALLKQIKNLSEEEVIAYAAVVCFFCSSIFANSMYYTTPYFCIFFGIVLSCFYRKHIKN